MTTTFEALLTRRAEQVTRWHHRPTRQEESIASHQWSAAVLGYVLAWYLRKAGHEIDPHRVMMLGMFHDMHETITGDIPSPFKSSAPEITRIWEEWESQAADRLWLDLDPDLRADLRQWVMPAESSLEMEIAKFADRLSALAFLEQEVQQGNLLLFDARRETAQSLLDMGGAAYGWPRVWFNDLLIEIHGMEKYLRAVAHGGAVERPIL